MPADKASKFLQAMNPGAEDQAAAASPQPVPVAPRPAKAVEAKPATRAGLKHIGGYFDRDTVEMVAVLRARLALDNSELLKLAINDLYKKNNTKRAYGDA